jgi:hypothetical protein
MYFITRRRRSSRSSRSDVLQIRDHGEMVARELGVRERDLRSHRLERGMGMAATGLSARPDPGSPPSSHQT